MTAATTSDKNEPSISAKVPDEIQNAGDGGQQYAERASSARTSHSHEVRGRGGHMRGNYEHRGNRGGQRGGYRGRSYHMGAM